MKWGKTAQSLTQAAWVPLVRLDSGEACPVRLLDRLLVALGSLPLSAPLFSFPPSSGGRPASPQGSLNIPLAREWLALYLGFLGRAALASTLHSFRRGACTRAFRRGASLSDIKQLGGWSGESVQLYFSGLDARRRAAAFLAGGDPTNV